MIRLTRLVLFLATAAMIGVHATATAAAAPASHDAKVTSAARVYQCPMHPWIKSDRPGKCTICGMDLVAANSATSLAKDVVTLAPSQITTIGVATTRVSRQPVARTLRVAGRIDDDDTRHRILAARVPGRIEKLFVTY